LLSSLLKKTAPNAGGDIVKDANGSELATHNLTVTFGNIGESRLKVEVLEPASILIKGGKNKLEHYDGYIVDSEDIWWYASSGRGTPEEATEEAREQLNIRWQSPSGQNYKPEKLIIFKCASISETLIF